ncbi:hypothetical protein D3C75_819780 [compost metagenome]
MEHVDHVLALEPRGDDAADFRFGVLGHQAEAHLRQALGDQLAHLAVLVADEAEQPAGGDALDHVGAHQVVAVGGHLLELFQRQAVGDGDAHFAVLVLQQRDQLLARQAVGHRAAHHLVAVADQRGQRLDRGVAHGDGAALPERVAEVLPGHLRVVAEEAVDLPAALHRHAGIARGTAAGQQQAAAEGACAAVADGGVVRALIVEHASPQSGMTSASTMPEAASGSLLSTEQ